MAPSDSPLIKRKVHDLHSVQMPKEGRFLCGKGDYSTVELASQRLAERRGDEGDAGNCEKLGSGPR